MVGVAVFVLGLNFAVDPLQIFRRAAFYEPTYSLNQRYQNAGLLRTQDYRIIVIGDSHAENFRPSLVESILGEPAVRLAISGSKAPEQALVAEAAIATGKVHRVIWSLGDLGFLRTNLAAGEDDFPTYLYRPDRLGRLRYLASSDTLWLSARALVGLGPSDLDDLGTWDHESEFGPRAVAESWQLHGAVLRLAGDAGARARQYPQRRRRHEQSIEENLARVVREHPDVEFDLFFPPYSIYAYLSDMRAWPGGFRERLEWKADVMRSIGRLPNARLFDFQVVEEITHDPRRYKDIMHFDGEVNAYILRAIRDGRHAVHPDDYAATLALHRRQVEAFRDSVCAASGGRHGFCPTPSAGD